MAYVKASERQGQIVAAARRVMSRQGVARTTLRDVANEADIALGTLHYVFSSKDALMRAVITDLVDDIWRTLLGGLQPASGLARALGAGLRTGWRRVVDGDLGEQVMQFELSTYSLRSEDDGAMARWQYNRYTGLLAAWCRQAAEAADERCAVDFDTLSRLTLALLDGLVLQYVVGRDPERSSNDLDHAIEMLVQLADPRPASQH